jgi:acyl carrier protein
MLARLGEIAVERGLERVDIPFVAGPRNRPAALFLESLRTPEADGVFHFPAEEAAAVRLRTANVPRAAAPAPAASSRPARKRVDYGRIASELREPEAILERIRAATRRAPVRASLDPPRTALERDLAELWAGLLNVPAVGINDNFFDLGGHSLLAVQLLSRVRQIHGVDLSLEVVYSGEFTVAELAKAIELKEIEQSSGEYEDLLKELEDLSDEQVRELLAQEQDAK